jgi:hypothetical protein
LCHTAWSDSSQTHHNLHQLIALTHMKSCAFPLVVVHSQAVTVSAEKPVFHITQAEVWDVWFPQQGRC